MTEQHATSTQPKPILVLGATGKTGRRIVQRLQARKLPVRLGSRSGSPRFDWEDPSTWPAVLEGVDRVYISYYPDLAVPGAVDAVAALTDLAVRSGVRRMVLLSGRGEEEAERAEQVVQEAGVDSTILRCAFFNQNFDEGDWSDQIKSGQLVAPVVKALEPFVDADDIADVAVAALTEDGHAGELYELTGPRLMSFTDVVTEIGAASGRDMTYIPVSLDDYKAALAEEGLPADLVWLLTYLFDEVLDGRNERVTDGVQRALGRPPRDFSDFAKDAAATGVWSA